MRVLDLLFRNAGVFGITDFGISPFQPWVFEDRYLEIGRLMLPIFDPVGEIARYVRDAAAKDRVIQILDQGKAAGVACAGIDD